MQIFRASFKLIFRSDSPAGAWYGWIVRAAIAWRALLTWQLWSIAQTSDV